MLSHFSVKNYKCLADVTLPLTPIHLCLAHIGLGCFAADLLDPRGTGQHRGGTGINIHQPDAMIGENNFADLVGVLHPARFQNVKSAIALAPRLDVAQ